MAFVTIADADEILEGQRLVAEIGDIWVVVFNVDGKLYAVEDLCTHEEEYLSEGEILPDKRIECAAHGATFDLETGDATMPAVQPVPVFAVRVQDGDVQVDVEQQLNA